MNIGYIFDISQLINEEAVMIPHLSGLCFKHFNLEDFTIHNVINFRDEMMKKNGGIEIDKHIFFVVIKNSLETIEKVALCLAEMQRDKIHFNQEHYEVHVLLNLINDTGVSIKEYESKMQCLKNNSVCIYTWLLDKYDYSGGMPIIDMRRSHAIARFAYIVSRHRRDLSLRQMNNDFNPIYTLFGDSSIFFNDDERDQTVRYYYFYKSLQHLLNLSDQSVEDYFKEHILPYQTNEEEMNKRLDVSSTSFLHDNTSSIEASLITEQTQGLLLKSSDKDNDYLINATDNGLVFIEELSRKQEWQMKDTANFVNNYWKRISDGKEDQDTITDDFICNIKDNVVVHKRTVFDTINNEVSRSRKTQANDFKGKVDKYLLKFLNGKDAHNYSVLSETLTLADVRGHYSNIDCGIAFLDYLESGNSDYLNDTEVSSGDIDLLKIKKSLLREEHSRRCALNLMEEEIENSYKSGIDGKPSVVKSKFDTIDKEINMYAEKIRLLTFQLENWIDVDQSNKVTARSKSVISFVLGTLISGTWITIYYRWINEIANFDKSAVLLSVITFLLGLIIGFLILLNVVAKRRSFEKLLSNSKNKKKQLMHECMDKMKKLVEKRYLHMLSYHGLKTINELIDYARNRKEDLVSFRKTLFRCLVNYRLSSMIKTEHFPEDYNTIELNDKNVNRLLFGADDSRKKVPFCFFNNAGTSLYDAFDYFKKKKVRLETKRFASDYKPQDDFDPAAIDKEIIACRKEDESENIHYTPLKDESILPNAEGVEIGDVNQGKCGDCYFMATLASIAQITPEYIIGKRGMIEPLGDENRYFRVKFYDNEGNRINVDIDNKFWNKDGRPIYAGIGKNKSSDNSSYDPWVMAVEKAWAKVNNGGYDNIEGADSDGHERVRMVEYSYAVTGKSAFYCKTKNVPDRHKLQEMIKKHVLQNKLPITLYSASPSDTSFSNKDPYLVENHAYSLKSVNEDGTFDIFNPWNEYRADEDVRGKHYERVGVDFIKDNFDVVVFFGIKETDFMSFERDLTGNASEIELVSEIENLMDKELNKLDCDVRKLEELMADEVFDKLYIQSSYLFNRTRIKDTRGINSDGKHIIYVEPARGCEKANNRLKSFLKEEKGESNLMMLNFRSDNKQSLTVFRISPHYVLQNFYDTAE